MAEMRDSVKGDILLVDDNPDNLKLLAKILTENGFSVRASDSGSYALKSIKKLRPDLILLDIKMPNMNGYEVCHLLKTDPLLANIPIIFISALKEEESKVKGFEVGGVDYITKPFQSQEILARVRTHLSMSRMQHHLEEMVHERTSELRAASVRFRKLFELASDAFFIHDVDGTIIDINRQACKRLGYTREEILQLKIPEIEIGHSHERSINLCKGADKGQQVVTTGQHRRKDGSAFPVETSLGLFQEQEPKLYLAIARDLSDRKKAEGEILRSKILLESSIESLKDMIILSLDCEYRYLYFNKTHAELMSHVYKTQPEIGSCIFDHMRGQDDIKRVKEHYDRALSGEGHVSIDEYGEEQFRCYYEVRYNPIYDQKKEIVGITAFAQNITERKHAEEELKKYQEKLAELVKERTAELENEIETRKRTEHEMLEAKETAEVANTAKSKFLANISHELRNPMHQILSYSKYGIDKIEKPKEKLLHYFNQSRNAAERLMVLLNDLLDLSKMEADKMEYNMARSNVYQIVSEAVSELAPMLKEKNLFLKITDPDASIYIKCDNYKIGQVVRNILSNAIKFSVEGGRITICYKERLFDSCNNDLNGVQVSISDQGMGIPNDELKSIFDKFTQSSVTKTGAGGTGLGLAICQEIMKAHKGKIWAENNPTNGATFSFLLPYEKMGSGL